MIGYIIVAFCVGFCCTLIAIGAFVASSGKLRAFPERDAWGEK